MLPPSLTWVAVWINCIFYCVNTPGSCERKWYSMTHLCGQIIRKHKPWQRKILAMRMQIPLTRSTPHLRNQVKRAATLTYGNIISENVIQSIITVAEPQGRVAAEEAGFFLSDSSHRFTSFGETTRVYLQFLSRVYSVFFFAGVCLHTVIKFFSLFTNVNVHHAHTCRNEDLD